VDFDKVDKGFVRSRDSIAPVFNTDLVLKSLHT